MTAPRHFVAVFALLALLLGAGCSDGAAPLGPETEEPTFIEGRQLRRQSRNNEALNAFLKVIEKRGQRESAESHLEAGQLFLEHMKDPVAAIYHLRKYLEFQPNSSEAERVRSLLRRAMRDFASTMPGNIDQSVRVGVNEELEKVRRENQELRAENATLRGGGATPVYRPPPSGVQLSLDSRARTSVAAGDPRSVAVSPGPARDEQGLQPAPLPAPARPLNATPARGPAPSPNTARGATAPTGVTHTVRQSEGLFAIARRYDPSNAAAKMQKIIEANADVLPNGINTPLRPGMVLRIP